MIKNYNMKNPCQGCNKPKEYPLCKRCIEQNTEEVKRLIELNRIKYESKDL